MSPDRIPPSSAHEQLRRRLLLGVAGLVVAVAGLGCAALQQVHADVMSFGGWPADRPAGRYQFERLPSQQQAGAVQDEVEAAAAAALARVGFVRVGVPAGAAAEGTEADVLVQIGVRGYRVLDPWADPGWVGPRMHPWSAWGWWGSGWGPGLGLRWTSNLPRDVQEVALLLIDRRDHRVLYEGRARTELRGTPAVLQALFAATLQGFPDLSAGTREISVPLVPEPASAAQ